MSANGNFNSGVPSVPSSPMVTDDLIPTPTWYAFFVSLWARTGGGVANITPLLDLITSSVGSTIYRGANAWQGLAAGIKYQVLRQGTAIPEWDWLDGNSFQSQSKNLFFSSPSTASGVPTFRNISTTDLQPVAGAIPGTNAVGLAAAGNVGEIISATVASGSAVSLTNAVAANIASVTLTPGDWDVWATLAVTPATSMTVFSGWISAVSAVDPGAPNGGAYVLSQPVAALTAVQVMPIGTLTVEVGTSTPIYLSAKVTFTGTATAYGALIARRRR